MAGSLNRVQLIGNVGKDPEIRSVTSGDKVANFSLAMSESWKDKDGNKQEKTEWANIVVWGDGLVNVIEKYVQKGSKVFVEGKFVTRKYEKDGQDRYTTEVVLSGFGSQLILLGDAGGGSSRPPADDTPPAGRPGADRAQAFDDDIPF